MTNHGNEVQCCAKFDPEPWHEKEIIWKDKLFIKGTMPQFMHMPLPGAFAKTVARIWKKLEDSKAAPDTKDFIMLAAESSPWKGEVYINATKEVSGFENVKLSGTFITKVFDGAFNDIPKWADEMTQYVNKKSKVVKKYYFYYTTCPKCAKMYGHNYVVAFAEV
jgi:hypothetical protein